VVETEVDGDVGVIYLNRPESLNAVNTDLVEDLLTALGAVAREPVGSVVLTGRGRAFCAGHDLKAVRDDAGDLLARLHGIQEVTRRIRGLTVPVVAAVHGHAIGAGVEFALGCDLLVAAEDTRFRFPEVGLGLSVTGGVSKLLPLLVGPLKAKELVLLGEPVDAAEALRLGLVNKVVPADSLLSTALAWAARLAAQPRISTALAKEALDAGIDSALATALSLEISHAIVTETAAGEQCGADALATSRARNAL
jgi:2-(1,2-epoxy-1,2-dihydrophenyl)acetyl-CoA isomerase